jgi:hypothetical protein
MPAERRSFVTRLSSLVHWSALDSIHVFAFSSKPQICSFARHCTITSDIYRRAWLTFRRFCSSTWRKLATIHWVDAMSSTSSCRANMWLISWKSAEVCKKISFARKTVQNARRRSFSHRLRCWDHGLQCGHNRFAATSPSQALPNPMITLAPR